MIFEIQNQNFKTFIFVMSTKEISDPVPLLLISINYFDLRDVTLNDDNTRCYFS